MRTGATLSIIIPPAELRRAEKLAQKEHLSIEQLLTEALRTHSEQRKFRKPRNSAEALELSRQDADRKRLNKLSAHDINGQIEAYRQEVHSRGRRKKAVESFISRGY